MKNETMYRYQIGLSNGDSMIYDCKHSSVANFILYSFNDSSDWLYVGGRNNAVNKNSIASIKFVEEVK